MNSRIMPFGTAVAWLAAIAISTPLAAQDHRNQPSTYRVGRLGTLGGTVAGAGSIDNRGWVTGFSNVKGDKSQHAVLWLEGKTIDLETLGGSNSGVEWPVKNDRGQIVGISETSTVDPLREGWSCAAFFSAPSGHTCLGFAWQNGIMIPLPTLGGNNGHAAGANNRGEVVGWAENPVHDPTCVAVLQFEAVIWGPNRSQVRQLPPFSGDVDTAATAINDQGQVVGISGICDVAVGRFSATQAVPWQDGKMTNRAASEASPGTLPPPSTIRDGWLDFPTSPATRTGSPTSTPSSGPRTKACRTSAPFPVTPSASPTALTCRARWSD